MLSNGNKTGDFSLKTRTETLEKDSGICDRQQPRGRYCLSTQRQKLSSKLAALL